MKKLLWQLANVHGDQVVIRMSCYAGNPEALHETRVDVSGGNDTMTRSVPCYLDWFSDARIEEQTRYLMDRTGKGLIYLVRTLKSGGTSVDGPFFVSDDAGPGGREMLVHLQTLADEIVAEFSRGHEMSIPYESKAFEKGQGFA